MTYAQLKARLEEATATIAALQAQLVRQDERFEQGDMRSESRMVRAEVKLDLRDVLTPRSHSQAALTALLEQSIHDVRDDVTRAAQEYVFVSRFESMGPVGPNTTVRAELGIWRPLERPIAWPVRSSTVLSPLHEQRVDAGPPLPASARRRGLEGDWADRLYPKARKP